MKKKILVVLLATVMVFAFSAMAMAAELTPSATISVTGETASADGAYDIANTGSISFAVAVEDGTASSYAWTIDGGTPSVGATLINSFAAGHYEIAVAVTLDDGTVVNDEIDIYVGNYDDDLAVEMKGSGVGTNFAKETTVDTATKKVYVYTTKNFSGTLTDANFDTNPAAATYAASKITFDAENGREVVYTVVLVNTYDVAVITSIDVDGDNVKPDKNNVFDYTYDYGTKKLTVELIGMPYGASYDIDDADGLTIDDDEDDKFVITGLANDDYTIEFTVWSMDGEEYTEYILELEVGEAVFLDDLEIFIGDRDADEEVDSTMYPGKFDDETLTYNIFVPYDADLKGNVYAHLTADFDSKASASISGGATGTLNSKNDYTASGKLSLGDVTTFTITVKKSGIETEYTVNVYYASRNADNDSAVLSGLSVKYKDVANKNKLTNATLSPSFDSKTSTYSVALPVKTTDAELIWKAKSSENIMAVIVNDVMLSSTTGSTVKIEDLKSGSNVYEIVLIGEDCEVAGSYKVTLTVGEAAGLTNLVWAFNGGTYGTAPTFAATLFNYVACVPNSITSVNVTPTAADSAATITIYNGASQLSSNAKSGGVVSNIALNEGLNEVKVSVKSGSTTQTYTLNVYRLAANPTYKVSSQTLSINGVSKVFNAVNINGNNFVRLRDIANALNGSAKNFNVTFTGSDNTAALTSKTAYVADPGNPDNQPVNFVNPQVTSQSITLDGKVVYVAAYNVGGSNYVNLRQICALLDINVSYNAYSKAIALSTASGYVANQ